MISGIIKVSASVITLGLRPRLIILASTLIIPDITKTSSNYCFLLIFFLQAPLHPCKKKEDCHENAECHQGKCHCSRKTVGNGKYCEGNIVKRYLVKSADWFSYSWGQRDKRFIVFEKFSGWCFLPILNNDISEIKKLRSRVDGMSNRSNKAVFLNSYETVWKRPKLLIYSSTFYRIKHMSEGLWGKVWGGWQQSDIVCCGSFVSWPTWMQMSSGF